MEAYLKRGYIVIFEHDVVKISLNVFKIGTRKDNNLFQMFFHTVLKNENCAAVVSDLQFLHCGMSVSDVSTARLYMK